MNFKTDKQRAELAEAFIKYCGWWDGYIQWLQEDEDYYGR